MTVGEVGSVRGWGSCIHVIFSQGSSLFIPTFVRMEALDQYFLCLFKELPLLFGMVTFRFVV